MNYKPPESLTMIFGGTAQKIWDGVMDQNPTLCPPNHSQGGPESIARQAGLFFGLGSAIQFTIQHMPKEPEEYVRTLEQARDWFMELSEDLLGDIEEMDKKRVDDFLKDMGIQLGYASATDSQPVSGKVWNPKPRDQ